MSANVTYSEPLAARICEALAAGRTLHWVSFEPWAPAQSTLSKWLRGRPAFAEAVARARAEGEAARGGAPLGRMGWGTWSEELAEVFLDRVRGGRSITSVARDLDMPCVATVYHWRLRHDGFARALAAVTGRSGQGRAPGAGRGLPRRYGEGVAKEIVERLMEGESLTSICRSPGMPALSTVLRWRSERADFAAAYDLARDAQSEVLADEVVDIADAVEAAPSAVARARAMIDARKWRVMSLSARTARVRALAAATAVPAAAQEGLSQAEVDALSDEELDAKIETALALIAEDKEKRRLAALGPAGRAAGGA